MLPASFNIIPVKDKKPTVSWSKWITEAQTRQEKDAVASSASPGEVGVITGPVSGIFVLDIDGAEGEKAVENKYIPKTWEVKTPRGRHLYFRWTTELSGVPTTKAGVLEGVDVRGEGGYVVWYGWRIPPYMAPLAAVPKWLLDLLKQSARKAVITAGVPQVMSTIREGNRNASFASLAGSLRSRGYDEDAIYGLLEPKARELAFPLDELRSVCRSICRYPTNIQTPVEGSKAVSASDFLSNIVPVKWICKPFLAEQAIAFIGGLPESRKSWVLLDMAVECARGGGMWLGRFPIEGKRVLLIDQERSMSEVQRRLGAILAAKGLQPSDVDGSLFIRVGTSTRINLQPSYEALRNEIADIRPQIVLVDSLATFHTKEESNRAEIQEVMERFKQLRNEFGCSIAIIHHDTKFSHQSHKEGNEPSYLDMAGNVAIPAAAESCLSVVKHDTDSSFLHHTKCTQGIKSPPFLIRVRDVEPDGSKIVVEAF